MCLKILYDTILSMFLNYMIVVGGVYFSILCLYDLQKDLFSVFLESKGLGLKAAVVRNMDPKRLQMPWRDAVNKRDCGVFTMRHMESFEGQAVKVWDCGLRKGNSDQLRA